MSATVPVADAVADLLVESGVRRVYTVPGESFLPLLEAFHRHPDLRVISTRHESGAAFMAEADGKLSDAPAVVMATRGVGAANLAIGLHTARQDSTPLIAFVGQVDTPHLGNEGFQEVDLPAFLREVTVWGATVHRSDRVGETVARAIVRATTGRGGPAVVAFPADTLEGQCPRQSPMLTPPRPAARPEDARHLADLLAAARRPVMIVGQHSDPVVSRELAEQYGAGVYAAFRRQDSFPNDDPHFLGHLTLGTPAETLTGLREADLVLVLGERLDETTAQGYTLPSTPARVVHVHPDPAVLGVHQRADLALTADPVVLARQLLELTDIVRPTVDDSWWRNGHANYLRAAAASAAPDGEGRLHPGRAIEAVRAVAPEETIVTNDAGNFSVFLHRQWMFRHPRTQAAPISGAMGYAVPGAIGAALARPGTPVLGVAGDGGFLMTATELETAVRVGADVKLLVLQNGLYGTIAMHQASGGRSVSACDIGPVDIAGLARSLGATAATVDNEVDLPAAATDLMGAQGPAVLVVQTDPDIIAPGRSLSALKGGKR